MRLNDRTADRQSHTHAIGLGRVKGVEETIQAFGLQAGAGILNADDHAPVLSRSVRINSSRRISLDSLIASTALRMKLSITCWSWIRSPATGGRPSASSVCSNVLLRRSSLPPRITSKTLAFYVDGLLVCCASLSWHARIAGNGIYSIGDSAGGERAPEMCDSQVSEQAVDCGDVTRDLGMIFLGIRTSRAEVAETPMQPNGADCSTTFNRDLPDFTRPARDRSQLTQSMARNSAEIAVYPDRTGASKCG